MIVAAAGDPASSPLLQLGVFLTTAGAAIAAVIGAVSSARSRREAAQSSQDAAKSADAHLTVEERIVGKDEFSEVVDGLRVIISTQGGQIEGLERRLTEKEGEVRGLRVEVQQCADDKVQLRQDFGVVVRRLRHQVIELGGTPDDG